MMPKRTPAYGPFARFLAELTDLMGKPVPERIDSDSFPELPDFAISQILGAFRFLRLIDEDGTPRLALAELINGSLADLPGRLKAILTDAYAEALNRVNLNNATVSELDSGLRIYNISGNTLQKARSFFIQAAAHAGMPLSRKLRGKPGRKSANVLPAAEPASATTTAKSPQPRGKKDDMQQSAGTTKTVRLRSGGTLTLSLGAVKFWDLRGDDREFVFKLVDDIQDYEKGGTSIVEIGRGKVGA